MTILKYEKREGDSSYFYLLALPLILVITPIVFYFCLIMKKFEDSKSTFQKLVFPVFVLSALIPLIVIPTLTVVTYDAWFVKYEAHQRYSESKFKRYFVMENPGVYYSTYEEVPREKAVEYYRNGYKFMSIKDSREWFERRNAWNSSFANPLYLLGWAIVLNIPLFFILLIERWVGWILKKEVKEVEKSFDEAA